MNHKRNLMRKEITMRSKMTRHVFPLLTVVFWAALSFARDNDYTRIIHLREAKDSIALERMIIDSSGKNGKWSQMGKEESGVLLAHALKSWNSIINETDDKKSLEHVREYAEKILSSYNAQETNNISVETEFDLVCILYEKYTYSKDQLTDHAWTHARRKGAKAFLHAWQRLEKALAEDMEANDLPQENVDIPEGVPGFPGMSSERIKDPGRRAEYEEATRANKKNIDAYNKRIRLQNSKKRYFRLVRKYLESTYTIAPYDNQELSALLDDYVEHPGTKAEFMEGIEGKQGVSEPSRYKNAKQK